MAKITKKSFVKGKYYRVSGEDWSYVIKFLEFDDDDDIVADLTLDTDECEFETDVCLCAFTSVETKRDATEEEIMWLLACEEAGEFVEKPEFIGYSIY